MNIIGKNFYFVSYFNRFSNHKFIFYFFPLIAFEIDYGLYNLKFAWLWFGFHVGYSPFDFPEDMRYK